MLCVKDRDGECKAYLGFRTAVDKTGPRQMRYSTGAFTITSWSRVLAHV